MGDSVLKQAVRRMEVAMMKGVRHATAGLAYGECAVLIVDLRLLFETIKRYGGRRDWTPTAEALEQLPAPVRKHIVALEMEVARLARVAVAQESRVRACETALQEIRHPPR